MFILHKRNPKFNPYGIRIYKWYIFVYTMSIFMPYTHKGQDAYLFQSANMLSTVKNKWRPALKIPWADKSNLVIYTSKVHLTARLPWPGSFLVYASGNHMQNLNCFPRLIWGNHCPDAYHLRKSWYCNQSPWRINSGCFLTYVSCFITICHLA